MNLPSRWRGLRPWRLLLLVPLLAALVFSLAYRTVEHLDQDPASVGVTVEGCSAACADAWRLALDERLGSFGFRVVATPADSAPVVRLRLERLSATEGVHEGSSRVRARATLSLSPADTIGEPLVLEAESDDVDASLLTIALAALDMRGDALVATLLAGLPPRDDSALSLERSDALTRARRDLPAWRHALAAFEDSCRGDDAQLASEEPNVSCMTRCGFELRSVAAGGASPRVQLRRAEWAIPLGNPRDVQRLELPGEFAPWTQTPTEPEGVVPISSHAGPARASSETRFAFIASDDNESVLILHDGTSHALKREHAPRVLVQPAPSPSGEWVAFLSAEHRRGVAHLERVPASGGLSRALFSYVEGFRWVAVDGQERLLALVSGADLAASPLPAHDAGTSEDQGFEDEPDEFALVEAGDALAPPGPYAVLLDPVSGAVLTRIGGRERLVRGLAGVHQGSLVVTFSTPNTESERCGLLFHDLATPEERAVETPCLTDPALLPDGSVVASAVATRPGDPLATDREIVVISPAGALAVLTANATDDLEPSAVGGDRVVFTRRLATRYARFPRSAACVVNR